MPVGFPIGILSYSSFTRRMERGLGVGASVRALPGAEKERMSERSEFLAPTANGFVRIAPKTPALDLFLCHFLFASR